MPAKILLYVFTALAISGYFSNAGAAEETPEPVKAVPGYVSLGDALVLNLSSGTRKLSFLQLKADVLVSNEQAIKVVKTHIPAIRHELIMLLSEQTVRDMKTPAKRELVRQQVTENVRIRLAEVAESTDVEEVLFSTFLVQ